MEAASLCAWQESNLRKVPSISGQEAGSEQYIARGSPVASSLGLSLGVAGGIRTAERISGRKKRVTSAWLDVQYIRCFLLSRVAEPFR
jgi:transketolase N-terminal domain/subunit